MSHPIARRAGMLALTAAMLMPSAGALSDVSSWAQEGVAAAQNAGLAPSSLSNSAASGSITRAEFCAVALNAYKAVSGKAVYVSGKKPFEDCSDPNVTAAYLLGIVKGVLHTFPENRKIARVHTDAHNVRRFGSGTFREIPLHRRRFAVSHGCNHGRHGTARDWPQALLQPLGYVDRVQIPFRFWHGAHLRIL